MPIIGLQKMIRQVGRIRMGEKGAKGQPQKLECWRMTSPDRAALDSAAALFGGAVKPWDGQPGQFELFTESKEIPILLAPVDMSQWYEEWSSGGCKRRCDGETCQLSSADGVQEVECSCDPENRTCKMVTRLSVMLPDLPAIGVWRLDTHGFYAAAELPTTAESLIRMAKNGKFVPALLAIEPRKVVRNGQTKQFIVPVIRVREKLSDVLSGRSAIALGEHSDADTAQGIGTGAPSLPSAGDLRPDQEGEVASNASALALVVSNFGLVNKAVDWLIAQNPDPDEAREILAAMAGGGGMGVQAAIVKAQAQGLAWSQVAAAVRTKSKPVEDDPRPRDEEEQPPLV